MNRFTSIIKYPAFLLPAFAMGISVASAGDKDCDCPCERDMASMTADQNQDRTASEKSAFTSTRSDTAARENAATKDHASNKAYASNKANAADNARAADKANASARANASAKSAVHDPNYLANQSANDYFSTDLIGQEITNRRNDEVVGEVSEILINRDGQIGAVIISTGGLMGLGKKDVAISWDQIKRTVDGEKMTLSVDFSAESLADAPAFSRNKSE